MRIFGVIIFSVFLLMLLFVNGYLALVAAFCFILLSKWNFKKLKGFVGEWRVRRLLATLSNQYAVYHNVYVRRADGKLTQVDHVIVSPYQVFVLETKNYAGTIYGEESDTYWTQALGQKERLFYNPILQNTGHVKALLHEVRLMSEVQSVVVFSDRTRLRVNPYMETAKVLRNRDLLAYIGRFKRKRLSAAEMRDWNMMLQSLQKVKRCGRFKMRQEHLQGVRKILKRNETKDVQHVKKRESSQRNEGYYCPDCGEKLLLRKGKFGEFYGCSAFPICRYTIDVWRIG